VKIFENHYKLFNAHIENYKQNLSSKTPKELYEPENYILSLGGKRVRPLLALMACELFGKEASLALNSALCVELFHNFSLIHDDILDNAPLRRNQQTVHVKWNTNIAILSGDVMLVKAFEILQNYPTDEFAQLSKVFSKTAIEVCEGQQWDMNFETMNDVSVPDYIHMITFKTAVLLGCSLQMGAINACAKTEDQLHIYEFGKHLGIAFQLLDDMLDAYAIDKDKFGKQVGGDIISNKKTFLLLKAFELADQNQRTELNELLKISEEKAEEKIKGVINLFNKLGVKALCEAEADKHTKIALDHLEKINAPKEKIELLRSFAIELLNRTV